jgi:hypothetical protein
MSLRYEVNTANKMVRYATFIQYAVISRKSFCFQPAFFSFILVIPPPNDAIMKIIISEKKLPANILVSNQSPCRLYTFKDELASV